jgi:hypothetical protein
MPPPLPDVALEAQAIDRDNDDLTYRWSAGAGSFRDAAAAKTVWTAPLQPGPVPLTVTVIRRARRLRRQHGDRSGHAA